MPILSQLFSDGDATTNEASVTGETNVQVDATVAYSVDGAYRDETGDTHTTQHEGEIGVSLSTDALLGLDGETAGYAMDEDLS